MNENKKLYPERYETKTTTTTTKTERPDAPAADVEEIKAAPSAFPTDDDGYPLVDGNPMGDRQKQFYDKQIQKGFIYNPETGLYRKNPS